MTFYFIIDNNFVFSLYILRSRWNTMLTAICHKRLNSIIYPLIYPHIENMAVDNKSSTNFSYKSYILLVLYFKYFISYHSRMNYRWQVGNIIQVFPAVICLSISLYLSLSLYLGSSILSLVVTWPFYFGPVIKLWKFKNNTSQMSKVEIEPSENSLDNR